MNSIIISMFTSTIMFLWKRLRIVLIFLVILIIEISVLYQVYESKTTEARIDTAIELLEYNMEEQDGGAVLKVKLANCGEYGMKIPSLHVVFDEERVWAEPMNEKGYSDEVPFYVMSEIPAQSAIVVTYEIRDYEEYKEKLSEASEVFLRYSYAEQGGLKMTF